MLIDYRLLIYKKYLFKFFLFNVEFIPFFAFQAKCEFFIQKISKQHSWFFRFWSLWPKNEKWNEPNIKLDHWKFRSQYKDFYMLSGEWDHFPPISLLFFQNGQSDGLQGCDQWHEFYQYRHQGLWSTNQFLRLLQYASLFERRCLQQCKSYPK